ncbi:hypothetical protein [Desulfocurvibacter africanus]|uniref:hypothetical protein n=1 Tax=Desulfocurvibacter africanus TaxID=873 RepID=UPI0012684D58|nr:hypothetical protein [Desulfocurvibacter africanus]
MDSRRDACCFLGIIPKAGVHAVIDDLLESFFDEGILNGWMPIAVRQIGHSMKELGPGDRAGGFGADALCEKSSTRQLT